MALNPDDTLLNGHYRILRLLGRGGFGFIYQAQDTLLNEEVAIKELIPALVGDETMLKRFLAEARATMRLRHERIVGTHNVFREGGNYYIVMECMAGGSLEARMREGGPLPVEEAVRVVAEVCEGLAYAHKRGIVHCDLKPANILFDKEGHAKVADFGIAHVSGEMLTRSWMTPAGFVAGTLPYMSPEQADGVRDEPRIDVYAVGAVLYRLLTGRTYLEFDNHETPRAQMENLQRIYSQQPAAPSAHRASVPAWLDAVILQALAKQPAARYGSAAEMRAALLRARQPADRPAPAPEVAEPPIVLVEEQEAAAPALPKQPAPSPPVREAPGGARDKARAAAQEPVFRPLPEEQEAAAPAPRRAPVPRRRRGLPAWFWPAAGAAAVIVLLIVIISNAGHTPEPIIVEVTETSPVPPASTPRPQAPAAGATQTRGKDGMVMVYVPGGKFTMGSNEGGDDEKPVHTVNLSAFWIDGTEVTNAQFRQCVEAGACQAPTTCDWGDPTYNDADKADDPVVCVSWSQAKAYCGWAGARLPTEAEWEKAARGTDGRKYPWGNQDPDCNRANYRGTDGCVGDTSQVGRYPSGASPYGALDMAGNVWEWVADWYGEGYYARSPTNNPKGPDSGDYRVLRGGSWGSSPSYVRAANRSHPIPARRSHLIGFRCLASSPGE